MAVKLGPKIDKGYTLRLSSSREKEGSRSAGLEKLRNEKIYNLHTLLIFLSV